MSTVIVRFKEEHTPIVEEDKEKIDAALIKTTTQVFGITPEDVILDYSPITKMSVNTPDILLRAETSVRRQNLIKPWADALLNAIKSLNLPGNLRIAVKTYCIDSVWVT